MKRFCLLAVALAFAPACLVLSLNPAYDGETIAWDATRERRSGGTTGT